MIGYICRDKYGLFLSIPDYDDKPFHENEEEITPMGVTVRLDDSKYPKINFNNSPKAYQIILKPIPDPNMSEEEAFIKITTNFNQRRGFSVDKAVDAYENEWLEYYRYNYEEFKRKYERELAFKKERDAKKALFTNCEKR